MTANMRMTLSQPSSRTHFYIYKIDRNNNIPNVNTTHHIQSYVHTYLHTRPRYTLTCACSVRLCFVSQFYALGRYVSFSPILSIVIALFPTLAPSLEEILFTLSIHLSHARSTTHSRALSHSRAPPLTLAFYLLLALHLILALHLTLSLSFPRFSTFGLVTFFTFSYSVQLKLSQFHGLSPFLAMVLSFYHSQTYFFPQFSALT